MKLYIMRHGQAQVAAVSDQARSLTQTGRDESEFVAKWLERENSGFDITFVSPYRRALETYQLVSEHTKPSLQHFVLEELTPEADPSNCGDSLLAYCAQYTADSALVVSHLPLVALVISDLCPGVVVPSFSTSSVACLDIDLASWHGKLLWHKSFQQLLQSASEPLSAK